MSQQPEFTIVSQSPTIVTLPDGRIAQGSRIQFEFGPNRVGELTFTVDQIKNRDHFTEIAEFVRASLGG